MTPLDEYHSKRDFTRTPEPSGERPEGRPDWAGDGLAYVIHEHHARALHFDLRLERDGVLMSWAVPKGPSLDPKDKRLAVHVEDHPLEYGSFEGGIPEGEYGAGQVIQWDHGTWEPLQDPAVTLPKGELKFVLHGVKLQGAWMLVRMKPRPGEKREMWLLFKERDEYARSGFDTLAGLPGSVTGREPEGRAGASTGAAANGSGKGDDDTGPEGDQPGGSADPGDASAPAPAFDPSLIAGALEAPLPVAIEPMLATLRAATPPGGDWIHEIKLDGYRAIARVSEGHTRMLSRNGLDWTDRFGAAAEACAALPAREAILDGEAVVLGPSGVSSFGALQDALSAAPQRIVYFAFDLLYLDGHDLRGAGLLDRKKLLAGLLATAPEAGPVRYLDHVEGEGQAFHARACDFELEGVVSKRIGSRYTAGRSPAWVKSKCLLRQEFVVGGFTRGKGARTGPGALLVGYHDTDGGLRFAGRVGSGFTERTLTALAEALDTIATPDPPFADPPRGPGARDVTWVRPALVADVAFTEWTKDGILRQPVFEGLREDKDARDVVLETAAGPADAGAGADGGAPGPEDGLRSGGIAGAGRSAPDAAAGNAPAPEHRPRKVAPASVAGVRLSHPERLLFEDSEATKLDVARYYEAVADRMLPHLAGRPLTLLRCPHGVTQQCFYQRHIAEGPPPHVRSVPMPGLGDGQGFITVDGLPGLLELLQLGTLEFHTWGACMAEPDMPDTIVFDLDPGPGVTFDDVMDAARLVRMRLDGLGLPAFVKTTGGKGLHVVVPVTPDETWGRAEAFARALAEDVARVAPARYTTSMRKDRRDNAIFIDYVRNTKTASSVAPYSTRARPGAPVALPVAWEGLVSGLRPAVFGMTEAFESMQGPDPWASFREARAPVTPAARRSVGLDD